MTAAEFFNTGPETDGCELIRGEIVLMPPPADRHEVVCANSVYLLKTFVKHLGRGTVMCNDAGIITQHDPDTVRGADIAVFLNPSWQGGPAPDGYTNEAADLIVEVRSPKQSWAKVVEKIAEYLRMGVRLVWVIDPQRQRITVFAPDQEPTTYAAENELDGGEVLPGFRCRVAEFFE
jgi:Uma2 family endonuclease